jgi:uncharacterized protein
MHDAASAGTLVVAALSARVLAESAAQAGFGVLAIDLFGDADTRRASRQWWPLAAPGATAVDATLLAAALHEAARQPGVLGWIAGSGFDGVPECIDTAAAVLPRLGMPTAALRALRDPRQFFATIDHLGLPHPPVRFDPPPEPHGWLVKHFGGSGGWHIQPAARAAEPATAPGSYFQHAEAGTPMSALFLADGNSARIVALNRLTVRPLGALPFVYRGAIGPVDAPELQAELAAALALLVPAFGLRGLASLDFLAQGDSASLLEINPRPSATMELHASCWPQGLLHWHLQALQGRLPPIPLHRPGLRGSEIVFARHAGVVAAETAAALAADSACHDLPAAGTRFAAGDPVCSVGAEAGDLQAVENALADQRARIARLLNTLPHPSAERAP